MSDLLLTLAAALLASAAVNTAFNDACAGLLSRIPRVGPTLAVVSRELNPYMRHWLLHRVRESSEAVVKEVESGVPRTVEPEIANSVKKAEAVGRLLAREVGLRPELADFEIENALDRIKGASRIVERLSGVLK